MNATATSAAVYLRDYTVPDFFIPEIELDISLFEDEAVIQARLAVKRNDAATERAAPLRLDVDELTVEKVILDGITLAPDLYMLDERHLTIAKVPDSFELVTLSRIYPQKKYEADGDIYVQHGILQSV